MIVENAGNIVQPVPLGYVERPPPADLAPWVACLWTRRVALATRSPAVHRVLPDGCVDLLISFGGANRLDGDVSAAIGVGPMSKPIEISGSGPRFYAGVRFRPGRAYAALGIPASQLLDNMMDFELLPRASARELDALSAPTTDEERLHAIVQLVRRRMMDAAGVPLSVRIAIRKITSARGDLRIASLASDIGITRQQLARQFGSHVGVSPKMLARVMRVHAALARVHAARAADPRMVDWGAVAHDLGYYDQPHFIDDFKALTGVTPGEWSSAARDSMSAPGRTP